MLVFYLFLLLMPSPLLQWVGTKQQEFGVNSMQLLNYQVVLYLMFITAVYYFKSFVPSVGLIWSGLAMYAHFF